MKKLALILLAFLAIACNETSIKDKGLNIDKGRKEYKLPKWEREDGWIRDLWGHWHNPWANWEKEREKYLHGYKHWEIDEGNYNLGNTWFKILWTVEDTPGKIQWYVTKKAYSIFYKKMVLDYDKKTKRVIYSKDKLLNVNVRGVFLMKRIVRELQHYNLGVELGTYGCLGISSEFHCTRDNARILTKEQYEHHMKACPQTVILKY